jgi:hypothetical protein
MSETLYPHEIIIKNAIRIEYSLLFIGSGLYFGSGIIENNATVITIGLLICITAWICGNVDYKLRGLK